MKLSSLEAICAALDAANVAYLVVGGVAVNAYGYLRATADLDLVVGLSPANALAAVGALAGLGYKPQVPVPIESFADPEQRRDWIERRNMQVFSLVSERHRETTVDLFVIEPFDFDIEHRHANVVEIAPGRSIHLLRLPALIAMKHAAGRDRDRDDVEHLKTILELRGETDR